jgi:hypothetical protein
LRSTILGRWLLVAASIPALAACQRVSGGGLSTFIPTAPTVPTAQPLVWDSAEELRGWVNNSITKGVVSVQGRDAEAFIRAALGAEALLLRGPDLDPPVAGIRTVRLRYRWTPDAGQRTPLVGLVAYLQPLTMTTTSVPTALIVATPIADVWRESSLTFSDSSWAPLSTPMRYARLGDRRDGDTYPSQPGTLDIDWIRLER